MRLEGDAAFFGVAVPLDDFEALALAHFREVPDTAVVEGEGRRLAADDFPEEAVADFVKHVCYWGGYAGVWGRVLRDNDSGTVRTALVEARHHLGKASPDLIAALTSVNRLKGLGGVSFASKHLRFLCPQLCPVFDSYLAAALPYPFDRNGYASFAADCRWLGQVLTERGAANPWPSRDGQWFAADVEAAVFSFVRIQRGRFCARRPCRELAMPTLKERVLLAVNESPGLTDRELTDALLGPLVPPQSVNQVARALSAQGRVKRTRRGGRQTRKLPG